MMIIKICMTNDHYQDNNDDHKQGGHPDDSVFDTDDEPLSKVEQCK